MSLTAQEISTLVDSLIANEKIRIQANKDIKERSCITYLQHLERIEKKLLALQNP